MKIQFGTPVLSRDNKQIGLVKEVIIDPRGQSVTDLVIQEGLLFDNDKIISAELIAKATAGEVRLSVLADDLNEQSADYCADDYVAAADEAEDTEDRGLAGRYWLRPPGVAPSLIPPGFGRVELPPEVSIPIEDEALLHDSPVLTADGKKIGQVFEVITDDDDRITHVVVKEGVVYPAPKLIPVDWIAAIADSQIQLSVEKGVVDRLPDYEGD